MDEPENLPPGNKWNKRFAIIFLLLFGVFWSLGAFFFWVLLGLSAIFGLLAFTSSGIKIPAFNPFARPANPNNRNSGPTGSAQDRSSFKPLRAVLIGVGVIVLISNLVSVFSGSKTESPPGTSETENSQPVQNDDVTSLNDKGNAFFNESQYDSALHYYGKALKLDPSDQYAQYNRALVFFMTKDYRMSIGLIKKCLHEHPDYNEAWWLLGDGYYSKNYYDSATVSLERAYNNGFTDPNFLELLGDAYRAQNDLPKATEFYKKVVEQDTSNLEVYQQLITLDPGNADSYRKRIKSQSSN